MTHLANIDKDYASWIEELSRRYKHSQIKAATHVNSEMLQFYLLVVGKGYCDASCGKPLGRKIPCKFKLGPTCQTSGGKGTFGNKY